jgi:cobyrinic acid a,c-diamide synthase
MVSCPPAIVIAAPASGSGKTTVATGLMGALRGAGNQVAPFKIGPDFIDPGYHSLATGRPGRNLDPVLVPENLIGPLYRHGAHGADIAVIEGVMGLFDGRIDADSVLPARGSTAHVSELIGAAIVLVVDARGQSQSLGAVLQGFATFYRGVRIGGVILNRVGSSRHEYVLRQAADAVGIPVLGVLPRRDELAVPSRHLGLITAVEHGRSAQAAVDAMTSLVGQHVDLAAVAALADCRVQSARWQPEVVVGRAAPDRPVVAVAAGRAFSFGYAEHAELLRAAGAEVVAFDPLSDVLPPLTAALVLPGGFPEQYAAELSANSELREQIRALASRAPIQAECGGLAYLMTDLDGHELCGVVPGSGRFTKRLTLGYRDAVAISDSPLYQAGERVVGHEFHRTTVDYADAVQPAWAFRDNAGAPVREGFVQNGVHASYLHTHPAGHPQSIARFVGAAAKAIPAVENGERVR